MGNPNHGALLGDYVPRRGDARPYENLISMKLINKGEVIKKTLWILVINIKKSIGYKYISLLLFFSLFFTNNYLCIGQVYHQSMPVQLQSSRVPSSKHRENNTK